MSKLLVAALLVTSILSGASVSSARVAPRHLDGRTADRRRLRHEAARLAHRGGRYRFVLAHDAADRAMVVAATLDGATMKP